MSQRKKSAAKSDALSAAVPRANGNGYDCKSLATFIVDYQTYVDETDKQRFKTLVTQMDVETDTARTEEWGSIERIKPCEWMQQRLDEILAIQGIENRQTPLETLPAAPLNARILAYQIRSPSGSLRAEPPFIQVQQIMLAASSNFDLDIEFTLEGLSASKDKSLGGYHAGCHVIPCGSYQETMCLQGDRQRQLPVGKNIEIAYLEALQLPAGDYETWLSVTPDAAGSCPDLVKGPSIRVMEET
ncbi:MAG: hypothetical protein L3K52_04455 [Candidatus Thiothrix sulfatifontis]|nr:MAG: hypothetical protein L3K52_04455 [Candidatus Thiothrix sulfatifontis]